MEEAKDKEVFRLAAVLYSESNYEVSPKNIHKKIIESVFIDNNNTPLKIQEILDFIENNYTLLFSFDEVNSILTTSTDEHFLIYQNSEHELIASLTAKRKTLLESRLNQNNIDYFIDEFLTLNSDTTGQTDGKSLIYKYLYDLLNNNISSFSKLIDYKKGLPGAINIDDSFNTVEKQIINNFLMWENDGKNKAIFDISSYALEYCLITNNNTTSTFHLKNLKNKVFYLDTNIIFRAIGINGESRSNKTNTFLNKFKDAGETLLISCYTESEYKSTIKYYIDQISKKRFNYVNPKVFKRFNNDSEFFDYYQRWRVNRTNDSITYFESHLLSEYEAFKKRFNIKEDYNIPFNEKSDDVTKDINELTNDIFSFKNGEKTGHVRYDTCISDAKNLYLIKNKRNGNFKNIFESKYFFISSDQSLRRWDFKNSSSTPIVLLPSQWLSIILRYVNRTNDDFKSFVSFLNLSQNETKLNNEQLQLVLIGIGEITTDLEKQSGIVQIMIDQNFKGILENNLSEEEIIERSKEFAKSKLESDLDEIIETNHALLESLDAHRKGAKASIYDLEVEKQHETEKNKAIAIENKKLKKELKDKFIKNKLFYWKLLAFSLIPVLITVMFFYILIFCFHNWEYNFSHKLMLQIDHLPENSMEHEIAKEWIVNIVSLGSIGLIGNIIWNRLLSKTSYQKQVELIENKLPDKYR